MTTMTERRERLRKAVETAAAWFYRLCGFGSCTVGELIAVARELELAHEALSAATDAIGGEEGGGDAAAMKTIVEIEHDTFSGFSVALRETARRYDDGVLLANQGYSGDGWSALVFDVGRAETGAGSGAQAVDEPGD